MKKKNKILYLEVIRLIAITLAIYTHTGEKGMHYYIIADEKVSYFISVAFTLLSQTSVCLFFMISGALLLKKEEDIKTVWRKRLLRMILLTCFFVLFQYAYVCIKLGTWPNLLTYLRLLYSGGAIVQQWYLYAYIAFLIILPFLQKLVKLINDKGYYWYLFGIIIILDGICPLIERAMDWGNIGITVPFITNVIFYPVMGYYFANIFDEKKFAGKKLMFVSIGVLILYCFNTFLVHRGYVNTGEINSLTYFTSIYTIFIFVLIKKIFMRDENSNNIKLGKRGNAVILLGQGVFGTYLFEPQFREAFEFIYDGLQPCITHFPALALWLLASVLCGTLVMGFLKKYIKFI